MPHVPHFVLGLALTLPLASLDPQGSVSTNAGIELSESGTDAGRLDGALARLFGELKESTLSDATMVAADRRANEFFVDGVRGLGTGDGTPEPVVLKSYAVAEGAYRITVAFERRGSKGDFLHKIVEFVASPTPAGYRFSSPFALRTSDMLTTRVGKVHFHHRGSLDRVAAARFADFRSDFCADTGTKEELLDYYCFRSLDDLLSAHGFVFDAGRCNFLEHDLGLMDDRGRRFVTGTGRPDYIFGFVKGHLLHRVPCADDLYSPFVNGMAAYFGGYSLSGDSLLDLKAQFREHLKANPEADLLAMFREGRGASVHRHFAHFVLCAFLCEAAIREGGMDAALQLAHSGPDGAEFFPSLERLLGVTEEGFHACLVAMIGA